ncbi:DUF917 domain-containing protein [Aliiglaciecola litoralis]|uniref:DUF917 domain-containing protein n=1 Tax=Aliiglaciecola litoralis TaxID=582857 RepID=A0ABP3WMP3_9ALTE
MGRLLSQQELADMLVGSCIQSTRGCDSAPLIKQVNAALKAGQVFRMVSPDDFPETGLVAAVQGLGGGGAWQYVTERTEKQQVGTISLSQQNSLVIDLLSNYMGREVKALIRSEAADATLTALMVSSEKGIPVLDAGITGRAVPEVQQSIPWINGIASIPTAIVTQWGDEIIIKHALDEYRVEDIGRAIAVASGGAATITMTPMSGKELEKGIIAGNLSEAILLGKTVRQAKEMSNDPIDALLKVTNGYKLFQGIVTKSDEKGDRGFNWVDVQLTGTKEFAGHSYKIFVKNENIVGWLDGKLDAISPDYIYNLDPKTGESTPEGGSIGGYPLTKEVVILGVAAHAQWRSEKGIALMGPRHFGFDFDFIPIEKLQRNRALD